jgi:hypothetical protein
MLIGSCSVLSGKWWKRGTWRDVSPAGFCKGQFYPLPWMSRSRDLNIGIISRSEVASIVGIWADHLLFSILHFYPVQACIGIPFPWYKFSCWLDSSQPFLWDDYLYLLRVAEKLWKRGTWRDASPAGFWGCIHCAPLVAVWAAQLLFSILLFYPVQACIGIKKKPLLWGKTAPTVFQSSTGAPDISLTGAQPESCGCFEVQLMTNLVHEGPPNTCWFSEWPFFTRA